jgi:CrcB protein
MTVDGRVLAVVFAGGSVGALARVGLTDAVVHDPGRWPWATFMANVVASALLGHLATRPQARPPTAADRGPLLVIAVCGGLSTFSTMQVELLEMLDAGRVGLAVGYAAAGVVAGLLAVAVATRLTRRAEVAA